MALIKCPECCREISDKAAACPNCGYPISSTVGNSKSNYAQVRVVCKTASLRIDEQSASHGSIINIKVNGSKSVRISAWGGAVGMFGSGITVTVTAGRKYDLDMHHTWKGRMLYLKEVEAFI